ncbi:hypothetical protein [Mobilicoccus sp.]|uniref:hypothetical protein n=1 Tax=Mobilicoccus sp. TaxID=2034349 RepID=UPI0028A694D3|nr:hypothetical protein [Mobilicoccus sp.]
MAASRRLLGRLAAATAGAVGLVVLTPRIARTPGDPGPGGSRPRAGAGTPEITDRTTARRVGDEQHRGDSGHDPG